MFLILLRYMALIVERGGIDILYRLDHLLLLLCPDGRNESRLIAIGGKELRNRFWGFVDLVDDPQYIDLTLGAHTYLTRSGGARHLPSALAAASGSYVLSGHDFAFTTTRRDDAEIEVRTDGNFIVSVANPDPSAWGLAEAPPLQDELFPEYEVHVTVPTPFPPAIQERFRGRRYIELDPELLDYPGAELIFVERERLTTTR